MVDLRRLADAHTPTVCAAAAAPVAPDVGAVPPLATVSGIWSTIACTFMYAMLSRLAVPAFATGRSWARSKMAPRSTQKGSSRGPAKTEPPPVREPMAGPVPPLTQCASYAPAVAGSAGL
jgi:hypothetical protein